MRLLRWFTAPLAPLYGAVVRARNQAFDAHPERSTRAGLPVVSIGNLSLGGTGKTPVALHLAEGLQTRGWTNVVVSRGYRGRRTVDPMAVEPDTQAALAGDEPALMARRLGSRRVVVARRRIEGARLALGFDPAPHCLLLDDGFQHRALHRDLDLLLLDGVKRWGNGRMVPLGDLREPLSSVARAHALVVTRAARAPLDEIRSWWTQHGSGGPLFTIDFAIRALRSWPGGERIPLPGPAERPCFAFCALGHPEAFLADLLVAGVRWVGDRAFPDHYPVTPKELLLLQVQAGAAGAEALVCSEKDAVKLGEAHIAVLGMPLLVAEQSVVGGGELLDWVEQRLAALG